MATDVAASTQHVRSESQDSRSLVLVLWAASVGAIAVLVIATGARTSQPTFPVRDIVLWTLVAMAADLLSIRFEHTITLSMSLPVTLAAAMLLSPLEAGIIAFAGSLDPLELRRQSSVSRMVFNRSQVALAVASASLVFHAVGADAGDWPLVALWTLVALAADFSVNVLFVGSMVAVKHRMPPAGAIRRMFGGRPGANALLYVSMGLMSPLIALTYREGGPFALVAFLAPLGIARLSFVQYQRLQEASSRMEAKDQAILKATELVGAERRDERLAIAGELHDEVLPPLFKVHLMGQVLRRDIESGHLLELDSDIPELLGATDAAQTAIRSLVQDLRRSPLGPGGLVPTLELLVRQVEESAGPRLQLSLDDVKCSHLAQLITYQVAREAITNACRYARAGCVSIRLWCESDTLRLLVNDDGIGFDRAHVDTMSHFGLQLMKERVEAAGGRIVIDSLLGVGTTVAMSLPADL
jgi:signal transduction histidine kinase